MKLTVESDLRYQPEAIKSITDLFAGQPMEETITAEMVKEQLADLVQNKNLSEFIL